MQFRAHGADDYTRSPVLLGLLCVLDHSAFNCRSFTRALFGFASLSAVYTSFDPTLDRALQRPSESPQVILADLSFFFDTKNGSVPRVLKRLELRRQLRQLGFFQVPTPKEMLELIGDALELFEVKG